MVGGGEGTLPFASEDSFNSPQSHRPLRRPLRRSEKREEVNKHILKEEEEKAKIQKVRGGRLRELSGDKRE